MGSPLNSYLHFVSRRLERDLQTPAFTHNKTVITHNKTVMPKTPIVNLLLITMALIK